MNALLPYRGKELSKLEDHDAKDLLQTITKIVPNRTYQAHFDYRPWYLWEVRNKSGQPLFILFEVDNTGPHPGTTPIRITELNQTGKVAGETTILTGHRCYLRRVNLETTLLDGEYPIITIGTGPGPGPGPNIYTQYYAKIERNYHLIRLEDYSGHATRNGYYVRHFQSGTALPKQDQSQWESDLFTNERARILRALLWLGGTHYDLKEGDKLDGQAEIREDVLLVRKVRANKKVIGRLKQLIESDDRWIREAAKLAASPKDWRF
jgi:hypothetical protein